MMIQIKNNDVMRGVLEHPWADKLKELVLWVESNWPGVVITCGYEKRNYSSVHDTNPLRGIDLRSRTFRDPKAVEKEINRVWSYDHARPEMSCCIFHDVGRGAHFHLQVHSNTARRSA